jgi:hypothetical protein
MKIGDKFRTTFNKKIYTAKGFFGATGVEYATSNEAANRNHLKNDDSVCIKILETGGACQVQDAIVITA